MQSLNDSISVKHAFTRKCSFCKQVMEISEGDVIYDAKWYHKVCWEGVEQVQSHNRASDSAFVSLTQYA
ncbi:hypothetical protein [Candidatus Nitrosotenuis cloacae]|jgi:hypothetical protein|uniref:hypothetical protein n=1 Tax=Candidatus Nitrosotenuis cloacae TaxID=1603555 RepID=UPI0022812A7A|nr:hypothetical protein [Candidatus Nitrosotenuis cloacae]